MKDLKEGLYNTRKADSTHVRKAIRTYISRACEYGSAKYERANYARPMALMREDFERFRSYLRAAKDHIEDCLEAMELHQAGDPYLTDPDGMQRAAYAEDTDTKADCLVGASGLPHVAHAGASLMMALTQATECGLLPRDPGQPWADRAVAQESAVESLGMGFDMEYPRPDACPHGDAVGGFCADCEGGYARRA